MAMQWRPRKVELKWMYSGPVDVNYLAAGLDEPSSLGRAVVRETAPTIDAAVVARCYVTQGMVIRPGSIRVIREGITVYPTSAGASDLDLLKKLGSGEDTSRVAEGLECLPRVRGFALRVGDVVEVYAASEEKNNTANGTA